MSYLRVLPLLVVLCALVGCGKPLHRAARNGDEGRVSSLIDRGSDIDALDGDGATALWYASQRGHIGVVELLLAHDADPGGAGGPQPLVIAAKARRSEVLRLLLEAGADPNRRGSSGNDALSETIMWGTEADARLHFDHGASPDGQPGAEVPPLLVACDTFGSIEMVRLLLRARADINIRGFDGQTALHMATGHDDVEIATFLLDAGIDPWLGITESFGRQNVPAGQTAMDRARTFHSPLCMELFRERGLIP